jgi:hypothetical protein
LLAAMMLLLWIYFLWEKVITYPVDNLLSDFWVQNTILFFVIFCSVHSISEELFWRISLPPQNKFFSLFRNMLFSGYHILVLYLFIQHIFLPIIFVGLWMAGMIRDWYYKKHLNTKLLYFSHIIIDLGIVLWFIFLQSTFHYNP